MQTKDAMRQVYVREAGYQAGLAGKSDDVPSSVGASERITWMQGWRSGILKRELIGAPSFIIELTDVIAALDKAFCESPMDKSSRAIVVLAFHDILKAKPGFDDLGFMLAATSLPSYNR